MLHTLTVTTKKKSLLAFPVFQVSQAAERLSRMDENQHLIFIFKKNVIVTLDETLEFLLRTDPEKRPEGRRGRRPPRCWRRRTSTPAPVPDSSLWPRQRSSERLSEDRKLSFLLLAFSLSRERHLFFTLSRLYSASRAADRATLRCRIGNCRS